MKNSILENPLADLNKYSPGHELTGRTMDLVLTTDETGRPYVISLNNARLPTVVRQQISMVNPIPLLFVTLSEIKNSLGESVSWLPNDGNGDGFYLGIPDDQTEI